MDMSRRARLLSGGDLPFRLPQGTSGLRVRLPIASISNFRAERYHVYLSICSLPRPVLALDGEATFTVERSRCRNFLPNSRVKLRDAIDVHT
jgi:hypothetical protein